MAANWVIILKPLQDLDMKLRDLKCRLRMVPVEVDKLNAAGVAAKKQVMDLRELVKSTELAIQRNENAISGVEAEIDKLKQQSSMVKKNTEYQLMLCDIERKKSQIGDLETKGIELLDELERHRQDYRAVYREAELKINAVKTEIGEFKSLVEEIRSEISALSLRRKETAQKISSDLLARYEELLSREDGMPMVAIDNNSCSHCSLTLTPQTLSTAKSGAAVECNNCHHLVYFE